MIKNLLRKWIIGPEIEELKRLRIQMTEEISKRYEIHTEMLTNVLDHCSHVEELVDDTLKSNKDIIEHNKKVLDKNEELLSMVELLNIIESKYELKK